jgi:short-chain fatty acids transporter
MSFINKYEQWFKRLLPAPFVIAILLTLLTVVLALLFGKANGNNLSIVEIALQWEEGLWNNSLLLVP